ncbi:phage holin family protein [Luteolibacter flavescens]|uniref:Phage holin family protein n=1 Tax=Luteolibacter flavescens TaxID=1859460 RepID=A0ABT3FW79_9BACT|nr:phage holin family protein [Luteolibacter flavescens]MCW1887820.1 phage holin family protein [Luteolibacter flavescens]
MSDVPDPEATQASSLRESAVEFISARMELLALESREAGQQAAKRGAMAAIIAGCAMTAWFTGIAGLIGWVAAAGDFPWHFAAIGAAVLHLAIAGVIVALLRKPSAPLFSLSKEELLKDRQWLLNLKDKS